MSLFEGYNFDEELKESELKNFNMINSNPETIEEKLDNF